MGTQNESVMDWQCWVPDSERLVCKSERSVREPSEQVPGVREGTMILVDWGICRIHMVPTWLKAKTGTSVSGAPRIHRQEPLPLGTLIGREIPNGPLFIVYFSSSSYPPTICGYIYSDL